MSVSIAGKGSPIAVDEGKQLLADLKDFLSKVSTASDESYTTRFETQISAAFKRAEIEVTQGKTFASSFNKAMFSDIAGNALATPGKIANDIKDYFLKAGFKSVEFTDYTGPDGMTETHTVRDDWEPRGWNTDPYISYIVTIE